MLRGCGFSLNPGKGAGQPISLRCSLPTLQHSRMFGLLSSSPLPGEPGSVTELPPPYTPSGCWQARDKDSLSRPGPPIPPSCVRAWHTAWCWPGSCLCQCLITSSARAWLWWLCSRPDPPGTGHIHGGVGRLCSAEEPVASEGSWSTELSPDPCLLALASTPSPGCKETKS